VLEQGRIGKGRAQQAGEAKVEAVAKGGTDTGANKQNEIAHRSKSSCLRAKKNRPAADRFLPPVSRQESSAPCGRFSGDPIPIAFEINDGAMQGQRGSQQTIRLQSHIVRVL